MHGPQSWCPIMHLYVSIDYSCADCGRVTSRCACKEYNKIKTLWSSGKPTQLGMTIGPGPRLDPDEPE